MKIKLSKNQWERIGKQANWMGELGGSEWQNTMKIINLGSSRFISALKTEVEAMKQSNTKEAQTSLRNLANTISMLNQAIQ